MEEARPGRRTSILQVHVREWVEDALDAAYPVLMGGMLRDLEPGLHISRCPREDFLRFMRTATFFTAFVRLRQVVCNSPSEGYTIDSSIPTMG